LELGEALPGVKVATVLPSNIGDVWQHCRAYLF